VIVAVKSHRTEVAGAHLVLEDADLSTWFDQHGVPTKTTGDVRAAAWRKLLGNVAGNTLTAICRTRFGALMSVQEIPPVMRAAVAETAAVARAEGVAVQDDDIDAVVEMLVGMPAEKTTSMLQDLEAGRSIEIDVITGVVVRKADQHGIDVPTVRTLDAILRVLSPKSR
jgi:2-dehydropantoate 2-reductase